MIQVELARERRRQALLGETDDLELAQAARRHHQQAVTHTQEQMGLGVQLVHSDVSTHARLCCLRARLEHARSTQPAIHPDGIHGAKV